MINKNQFQITILKEILSKHCNMKRTQNENGFIGVSDGFYMIFLRESELQIKLDSLAEFKFDLSDAFKSHPLLADSGIYKKSGTKVFAKLASEDGKTVSYLNETYLNKFKGYDFFSDGGIAPIYAKDKLGELVGLIMPVRQTAQTKF